MHSQGCNKGGGHAAGVLMVLVVALIATACGARVAPFLGTNSVAQGGTSNQGGTSSSGGATTTTGVGGLIGGTSGGTSGGSTGTGGSGSGPSAAGAPVAVPASPTSSGFNFSAQAEAGACQGSAGNGASDVGVSPTQLTFGNVSGLTGPLINSFNQGTQGVEALFSAVNAAGGICGRKLSLDAEDDTQNSATNASDVADLIPKVLAFVGSTSDGDNGGVPALTQANVPDVGFAINCNRSESPVYWSVAAGSCYQPQGASGPYFLTNSFFKLAKEQGYLPTKMAFLAYAIAISAQAAQQIENVYKSLGGTVCYSDFAVSPATASLESDVVAMQQAGCNGSFDTMDVTGNAKLLQAMQQLSYHPPYVAATFDAYTPAMISQAGQSAAQGLIVNLPFVPLSESQPMVQLYQQQLATYQPGNQPSGFGFMAWESAQMLIYALLQSGRSPTRASLAKVLGSLQNWTGGGALGGYTPSTRSVYNCDVDIEIHGSTFVRKAPSSGLYCGGQATQAS